MSGKQRRKEIMDKRRARMQPQLRVSVYEFPKPSGAVAADPDQLRHNTTCGAMPLFYLDQEFNCRDCGAEQIWTAKQQKWWYEIAKGNIDSTAVRCRPCRKIEQQRKADARKIQQAGLEKKKMRI